MSTLQNAGAGAAQAGLVTAVGYPFDLVKTRMQAAGTKDTMSVVMRVWQRQGLTGFYRGSLIPLASHLLKRPPQYVMSERMRMHWSGDVPPLANYYIGLAQGPIGGLIGTPLQLIKVRIQTSTEPIRIRDLCAEVYKIHGLKGFYRGLVPTLLKDSLFSASFLGHYYSLRDCIGSDRYYKNFFNGATAHCLTWCLLIPVDYVKTISQQSDVKRSIKDIVRQSYKDNGVGVFWRGLVPACLRTIPVSGIAMVGYEYVRSLLAPNQ